MKYQPDLHGPMPKMFEGKYPEIFYNPSRLCEPQNWIGTIYEPDGSPMNCLKYRTRYLSDSVRKGHIAITPFTGIRWAINEWTKPGDTILDPFTGSGTTLYEACLQGREAVGIEFEFPHVAREALSVFDSGWTLYEGDSAEQLDKIPDNSVDLINLSNPYPKGGDANQKGNIKFGASKEDRQDQRADYKKDGNLGLKEGSPYWEHMGVIHKKLIDKLKPGGRIVFVIKDMVRSKKIMPLHEMLADNLVEQNPDALEFEGTFCFPHYPKTLFMNTYPKRYPDVKIPLEQICPVFRKKS